jgi:starvation-inducible DNA-binding protein
MIALPHQQLAETVDGYSQTKQAHGDVKGINFYQLHLLSDEMAKSLIEIRDSIAERGMAPGGAQCASRIISYPSSKRT